MDKLALYTYVDGVNDTPFPDAEEQLVLNEFTYTADRMGGAPTISATAMHSKCLDNLWSDKVYVSFRGEKLYVMNTPSSSKDNSDARYKHEVEFLSEREVLNHVYFIDAVQGDSSVDVYKSNTSKVIFMGDIREFGKRLQACFDYLDLGYTVEFDETAISDEKLVSFEDKYILEALQEMYNTYEIPYYFKGKVVHIGSMSDYVISTPFEYGSKEALISVSKENANYAVINKIKGQGSSDNIPLYYPNESGDREAIETSGKKWITPMENLMPSIYRESEGATMFYEAKNNTYPDGEGGYYVFENEFSKNNQRQGTTNFEDIKPTIVGITNASGQRIDMFTEFAYDQNDNDEVDDEGNYLHPYFFAKLRKFDGENGFNLFDQAIESQTMQFSFTSGVCGACTFELGVGEETQKNIVQVDDSGNLLRDEEGDVRCGRDGKPEENPQDRQNDTSKYEVWIALKKEDSTYGQVMPNATQRLKPSTSDTFVILGISLPQAYILAAEKKLEESLIKAMWESNKEKFNFTIKPSRIYIKEHEEELDKMLNENSTVIVRYDGVDYSMYVNSYSYKVDENNSLPEIELSVSDTLAQGSNSLRTQLDAIKMDILSSIGSSDFLKQGIKYFLRKDVSDRAKGLITFLKGISIGDDIWGISSNGAAQLLSAIFNNGKASVSQDGAANFLSAIFNGGKAKVNSDGMAKFLSIILGTGIETENFSTGALGAGFCLKKDENGDTYLEVDKMLVRKVATFIKLLIQKLQYVGGQIILTPASMSCAKVEDMGDYYRCYFETDDGEKSIEQEFVVGDQARCQTFNIKEGVYENVSNTYYWRLVVGVGDDYIDLSKTDCDSGSTVPAAGDDIVQLGNRTDAERQAAIVLAAYGNEAPYIKLYRGINSYVLDGKEFVAISRSKVNIIADSLKFSTGEIVKDEISKAVTSSNEAVISANNAIASANEAKDKADSVNTDLQSYKTTVTQEFEAADGRLTSAITETKTYTDNAIGNIQVGGRNLFIISQGYEGYLNASDGSFTPKAGDADFVSNFISVDAESDITLSLCKSISRPAAYYLGRIIAYNSGKQFISVIKDSIDWENPTHQTFKTPSNTAYVRLSLIRGKESGNWKLEKGNKATDWTPAPEDVTSKIEENSAKINLLPDQITLQVKKDITGGSYNYISGTSTPSEIKLSETVGFVHNYYIHKECMGKKILTAYKLKLEGCTFTNDAIMITQVVPQGGWPSWYESIVPNKTLNKNGEFLIYGIYQVYSDLTDKALLNLRVYGVSGGTATISEMRCYEVQTDTVAESDILPWYPSKWDTEQLSSEIKQTADSITLTVKKEVGDLTIGGDNCIGNSDFQSTSGWSFTSNISISVDTSNVRQSGINTLRVVQSAATGSDMAYKIARNTSIKNGAASFSCWIKASIATSIKIYACGDNNIKDFEVGTSWTYITYENFTAENAYLRLAANNACTWYLSEPMLINANKVSPWQKNMSEQRQEISTIKQTSNSISLKVDVLGDNLEATGIDITNKKIDITADKLNIKTNSGKSVAIFDGTGDVPKLKADYIDAENLSVSKIYADSDNAPKQIVVDADEAYIRVFGLNTYNLSAPTNMYIEPIIDGDSSNYEAYTRIRMTGYKKEAGSSSGTGEINAIFSNRGLSIQDTGYQCMGLLNASFVRAGIYSTYGFYTKSFAFGNDGTEVRQGENYYKGADGFIEVGTTMYWFKDGLFIGTSASTNPHPPTSSKIYG